MRTIVLAAFGAVVLGIVLIVGATSEPQNDAAEGEVPPASQRQADLLDQMFSGGPQDLREQHDPSPAGTVDRPSYRPLGDVNVYVLDGRFRLLDPEGLDIEFHGRDATEAENLVTGSTSSGHPFSGFLLYSIPHPPIQLPDAEEIERIRSTQTPRTQEEHSPEGRGWTAEETAFDPALLVPNLGWVASTTSMSMAWEPSREFAPGRIYRDGELIGRLPAGQYGFSDTGLLPATSYKYELRRDDGRARLAIDLVTTASP